ncbi:cilia- and flagella-associated protein 36-like isoform X3 [Vespa mandarinia]|uniref:cilia- and flagella-associated protein 36-like isoform X3 n=1 Tax=Vespa mandarinia TaxID=7446 RepID=UPI00162182F3|nr:cilia- and flagella-associated protein 36-like isoform X3 [Vespa mandarinia]
MINEQKRKEIVNKGAKERKYRLKTHIFPRSAAIGPGKEFDVSNLTRHVVVLSGTLLSSSSFTPASFQDVTPLLQRTPPCAGLKRREGNVNTPKKDLLLGCFMEDMGITPEQFEYACNINKNTKMPIQFQQSLFEQIWAANEYEIFKRMMIQKNLELQLQALNMIEQKFGLTPASLMYETEGLQDEELVMEELINKHIMENQKEEQAIPTETSLVEEHERLANEYRNEKTLMKEALRATTRSSENSSLEPETNTTHENIKAQIEKLEKLPPLKTFQPLEPISSTKMERVRNNTKEEDIKRRQDYLKARRDELVALKKEVRSQRLEMNATRPSSARVVADATIKGEQELDIGQSLEPSILQVRKALAARLKAEVVHK